MKLAYEKTFTVIIDISAIKSYSGYIHEYPMVVNVNPVLVGTLPIAECSASAAKVWRWFRTSRHGGVLRLSSTVCEGEKDLFSIGRSSMNDSGDWRIIYE